LKRILLIGLCAIALGNYSLAGDLQDKVQALAAAHQGKVAFFAKDVKTGATVAIDADTPVQTASVIKLPIMIEAMYEVKAGKHRLDEKLKLTKDNQVEGSGVLVMMQPGLELTLEDVITLMIVESDNTATNMMIDFLGLPAINARITAMGLKNTYLYKKVFKAPEGPMPADQKKFGLGKTTAREMASVVESIQRCDLGDKKLCDKMIGIMKNNLDPTMMPRFIETADTSEVESAVAHKTGSLDDVRNDVGIVYRKHGPIIISAFTYDNKDHSWTVDNSAAILIGKMSKTIVDAWTEPTTAGASK
jgi:beta-lactamase class A